MLFFSKTKEYLKSLIKSDNGISSKSFMLVTTVCVCTFIIFTCGLSIIVDVICNGYIMSDMYGMAALFASIATLYGAVAWTKVNGERNSVDYIKYYKDLSTKSESFSGEICKKPSKDDIEKALE